MMALVKNQCLRYLLSRSYLNSAGILFVSYEHTHTLSLSPLANIILSCPSVHPALLSPPCPPPLLPPPPSLRPPPTSTSPPIYHHHRLLVLIYPNPSQSIPTHPNPSHPIPSHPVSYRIVSYHIVPSRPPISHVPQPENRGVCEQRAWRQVHSAGLGKVGSIQACPSPLSRELQKTKKKHPDTESESSKNTDRDDAMLNIYR
ncbi:hypothetical protein GGR56DRAFT_327804 [Xylariaceae sp. FL0804]|nr:hypothetical protein GGR56DRAFT_327804 [Xylariaceae sp. FL0804]